MNARARVVLLAAFAAATFLAAAGDLRAQEDFAPALRAALLKVHVTAQSWDDDSPWNKNRPRSGEAHGVVVRPGLVLTLASPLADHVMIELSEANSGRRYPATLEHIDYGCDLALLKIGDADLLERTKPLPLGGPLELDDEFEVWQLGSSDILERATGRVQKVAMNGVRLELTIKTTLSDFGKGQLAFRNGHIAGLVSQTVATRQEGRVIAVETIRHYLEDHDSGEYLGFGAGGIFLHRLLRDDLRSYYQVPAGEHGLGVNRVMPGRTGDGVLARGDVITHLAGYDLDDEGMFDHPLHGRLFMYSLLLGQTHPGETVKARILRQGEPLDVDLPVRGWPAEELLVPPMIRDARPPYIVVGGLVVRELHQGARRVSQRLAQYQSRASWFPQGERKRIVYASQVFADPANKGLDDLRNAILLTVNGKRIARIQDVAAALQSPMDGYHVFTFEGNTKDFVLKADDLAKIDERISKTYRIPELRYLGE